jgi:hypothetical protein
VRGIWRADGAVGGGDYSPADRISRRAAARHTALAMPSTPAIELARRRVEELDRRPLPIAAAEADPMLIRFASVLGSYTNTSMGSDSRTPLVLAAADADELVEGSALLEVFADHDVGLVRGPLPRERQQWIATGRHRLAREEASGPSRARFVAACDAPGPAPSTKPFDLGLFTSTATRGGPSGWRTVLDLSRGSSLYPLPWYVWDLEARADASRGISIGRGGRRRRRKTRSVSKSCTAG